MMAEGAAYAMNDIIRAIVLGTTRLSIFEQFREILTFVDSARQVLCVDQIAEIIANSENATDLAKIAAGYGLTADILLAFWCNLDEEERDRVRAWLAEHPEPV